MKKFNRTYVMGGLCLCLAAWIVWQTGKVPTRLVAREPGPRFFPYIAAGGIAGAEGSCTFALTGGEAELEKAAALVNALRA